MEWLRTYVVFILVCSSICLTQAEPIGHVSGTVYDASTRSPLVGVNITVLNTQLGAASDEQGRFAVINIPIGTYAVEASIIGYKSQIKTSVEVLPGRSTELVFYLSEALIEMSGVTVLAGYFSKVKDAPVSERNFSTKEIEVQPGGIGDISRVVQTMPAVVSTGDQDNEIIVRGGSPNENLFLVDGIEVPYPNHLNQRGEQGGGIHILNSLVIREIDFIAGAFPARYGDRSSSVMDITLRNGQKEKLGVNIDMGMSGLGMVMEGPLPGNGTFIGSYHKSLLEIMDKAGVLGMDVVPEYTNYLGKLSYNLSSSQKVSIMTIYAHDRAIAEPGEGIFDEDYAYDFQTSRLAFGASWQHLFGDRGFGKLLLSGSRTQWQGYSQKVVNNTPQDILDRTDAMEQSWGLQYDATCKWSTFHETQVGAAFKYTPFSHDIYVRAETIFVYIYDEDSMVIDSTPLLDEDNVPVVQGPVYSDIACHAYKTAAYVQHTFTLDHIGHLSLGLRGDYFDFTDQFTMSPRAGFTTEPLLFGCNFIAGFGWHYQSPQYHVLLADTGAHRTLKSQRSDHYVFGVERLITTDAKLTAEVFYKDIHNHHIPEHWTTEDPYDQGMTYLDIGKGYARGIELFLQKKFASNWHGTISYSFSQSKINDPQNTADMIPGTFDYGHVFTILGAYKIEFRKYPWYADMPGWIKYSIGSLLFSDIADIGFRFRFMGGRPYTPMQWRPDTRQWIEVSSALNSERLPDYHRLDIRWDHTYVLKNMNISWYIEVQNVYDRKNIWWHTYNDDGSIDEVYQFRLFPVGGFVIKF